MVNLPFIEKGVTFDTQATHQMHYNYQGYFDWTCHALVPLQVLI